METKNIKFFNKASSKVNKRNDCVYYLLNPKKIECIYEWTDLSLSQLYCEEFDLIKNNVSERTFVHRFAKKFDKYIAADLNKVMESENMDNHEIPQYFDDVEYNRTKNSLKYVGGQFYYYGEVELDQLEDDGEKVEVTSIEERKEPYTLFDLVFHQRGKNNLYPENLLHFEFKKKNGIGLEEDVKRLKSTTKMNKDFKTAISGYQIVEKGTNKPIGLKGDVKFDKEKHMYMVKGYQLGILVVYDEAGYEVSLYRNGKEVKKVYKVKKCSEEFTTRLKRKPNA